MEKEKILAEIENCIKDNMKDSQFCIRMLLDKFNISRSHFWELISKHYHMSPFKLIETIKLEKAIQLIAENNDSLLHISEEAGYKNIKPFRNAFKKRLKMTPSECKHRLLISLDIKNEINTLKARLK